MEKTSDKKIKQRTMMAIDLRTTVVQILKDNIGKKLTARELANEILKRKPKDVEEKRVNSGFKTMDECLSQIVAEIGASKHAIIKKDFHVRLTEERPRKYLYDMNATKEDEPIVSEKMESVFEETDDEYALYPKLCAFLYSNNNIYPKRIDEKTSSNSKGKKGNIWLHPDIVGLEFLASNYDEHIREFMNNVAPVEKIALYSYEVKIKLSKTNVRECYVQAATNSSWANYGYLVASEINEDVMDECKLLSNQFGIGLIRIDSEDPTENSNIVIQAQRKNLNWQTIDRIYRENKDFKVFIKYVNNSIKTNEVNPKDWDISEIDD